MFNVRVWELAGPVSAITSRDYYDLHDAIVSAAIDLGVTPDVDYPEWFHDAWERVAPGVRLYYSSESKIVAAIRDLSGQ